MTVTITSLGVLIFLGYAFWVIVTLVLCAWVLGGAAFFTMDAQNWKMWAVAITVVVGILAVSGYGLWALS